MNFETLISGHSSVNKELFLYLPLPLTLSLLIALMVLN